MKKIIVIFILSICSFLLFTSISKAEDSSWGSWTIKVVVTERVPWANCECTWGWCEEKPKGSWVKVCEAGWNCKYKCEVQKWFGSVVIMLWNIIKYFTFIALLAAVLFLVIWWIMYSMSWVDPSAKDKAKEKITQALMWIIVLLLSWVILNVIAPWIYK